jgi:hypothetical protein
MVNVGRGVGAQELTIDQETTPQGRRSVFQRINARSLLGGRAGVKELWTRIPGSHASIGHR